MESSIESLLEIKIRQISYNGIANNLARALDIVTLIQKSYNQKSVSIILVICQQKDLVGLFNPFTTWLLASCHPTLTILVPAGLLAGLLAMAGLTLGWGRPWAGLTLGWDWPWAGANPGLMANMSTFPTLIPWYPGIQRVSLSIQRLIQLKGDFIWFSSLHLRTEGKEAIGPGN